MFGVQPQNAAAHGVESAGPQKARGDAAVPRLAALLQRLRHDLLSAPYHVLRRAPGERQHENACRIHAVQHQMGGTVRKRVGLSGAGAGEDEQGTGIDTLVLRYDGAKGRGPTLRRVQLVECARTFRLHHKNGTVGLTCMYIQILT
jgi:hypothetical protein